MVSSCNTYGIFESLKLGPCFVLFAQVCPWTSPSRVSSLLLVLCWLSKRRADEMASWRKEPAPFKTNFLRKSHGDHPPRLYSYFNHDIVAKVAQYYCVNLPFRLYAVFSICQFINLPICPFCNILLFISLVFHQMVNSSAYHFVHSVNFCQFIYFLSFLLSVVLSICNLVTLTAHQLVIFSSCCFDHLSFHQVVNLSFSYKLFHKCWGCNPCFAFSSFHV
jgi:hypothetical protein